MRFERNCIQPFVMPGSPYFDFDACKSALSVMGSFSFLQMLKGEKESADIL